MLPGKKYCLFFIATMLCCQTLTAQHTGTEKIIDSAVISSSARIVVGDILLNGNKKTKEAIILREIPFKPGEEYPLEELVKKFETARRQLMNTALFNAVIIAAKNIEGVKINILVDVKERWYLFPVPYFKPADRNLNQWIVEQNASLSRINYGVKLFFNNATGRNDKFRLWLINGYTKQISASYDRLYIDKKLKWGMKLIFATGKGHEINYNTINDKQVFFRDENKFVHYFTNANAEITYRKAIKTRHSIGIEYVTEKVVDTVLTLNPAFFKSGRNSIRFPGIYYSMSYFNLDYIPYPSKGYATQLLFGKRGFNNSINIWQLHVKGLAVWPLSPKSFFSVNMYGGIKIPFKQPYFHQQFLGYGNVFMQGFEYYVIDGVAGGYLKTTYTRELLNFNIKGPQRKKAKESVKIPVRIFGKAYTNSGYVHNPQPGDNSLSNKMLYSGGFGIDILIFYDFTFKLEWTFNSLRQNGLFLHRKTIF